METFNKLCTQVTNSVTSTVSQLSGVLPGNPVTREFDATTHIASAGQGLMWKIYKGLKRSTKQEASIFVFEKRQLDKWKKSDREIILANLRRGVTQLTKIRHPHVLTVQHALEESRESLAFATEPVFASLANVLGNNTNMPQPSNICEYKLYDIEIKYGILQISEGLVFLHNDMKLLHKNISPDNIVINKEGLWKIFGFDFSVQNTSALNAPPFYPCEVYSVSVAPVCQNSLAYLAPECVLSQEQTPLSDMFSFGLLIYAVYAKKLDGIGLVSNMGEYRARLQQLAKISTGVLHCIPVNLRDHIKLLLSVAPENRMDALSFSKISYFDDFDVKTLNHLDSLLQWDNIQKSHFYKGLPEALAKLPHRVKLQRVLTCLARDLSQSIMVPFILPNIFIIAENCNKNEFCEYVFPILKPVMKLMEPIQVLLIMLQKMKILLNLTPPEDIHEHVLPMLHRGLDCNNPQIHELCLAIIPEFAGLLDQHHVKNGLLPRIKRLCLSTSSLPVRVNCLLCIGKLLQYLDKWLVIDEILPFLPQIPSREPAVLMGIVGIYKLTMSHKKLGMGKEIIASRVLPFLIPLCIENGLTLNQFDAMVALAKEMINVMETEHRIKLKDLNTVKEEQKTLTNRMSSMTNTSIASKPKELDFAFQGLELEKYVEKNNTAVERSNVSQQQISSSTSNVSSTSENVLNNWLMAANTSSSIVNSPMQLPTKKFEFKQNDSFNSNDFSSGLKHSNTFNNIAGSSNISRAPPPQPNFLQFNTSSPAINQLMPHSVSSNFNSSNDLKGLSKDEILDFLK